MQYAGEIHLTYVRLDFAIDLTPPLSPLLYLNGLSVGQKLNEPTKTFPSISKNLAWSREELRPLAGIT